MRAAARSTSGLFGHIVIARCKFWRACGMSLCFSHIWAAKIKNSGVGGPVGPLSDTASVFGWAGCITGWVGAFALPGISGILASIYRIGCFHAETAGVGCGAGWTPCQAGGACTAACGAGWTVCQAGCAW